MTFERFVHNVDAVVRTKTPAEYGLYADPHVAFRQQGAITARVREGSASDIELDVAHDETILATWG